MVKKEDTEALSSYLHDFLGQHPNTKDKTKSIIYDYEAYDVQDSLSTPIT